MWAVTLKQLRKEGACVSGYNKVVCMLSGKEFNPERESYMRFKYEGEISLTDIANNNGIEDALWATRCLVGKDRDLRLFAVWCVRQVQHLMTDVRSINAIDVAERYAKGNASDEELDAAMAAVTWAAAWVAKEDARDAVYITAYSLAKEDARVAAKDAQKQMFIDMCDGVAPWQVA